MNDTPPNGQNVQVPSEGTEPEVLSVEELMGEAHMPEVQAHTVDAAKSAKAEAQTVQDAGAGSPVKGKTDDLGRGFDASIHESDANGQPRLNKAGYIAKRRGGASKAGANPSQSKVNTKPKDKKVDAVPENLEPQIQATAQMSTAIFTTLATMIGGEEFKPVVDKATGENEPEMLTMVFANYYRDKGIIDIPPGVALTLGLGFYVAKRWNAPKFTERKARWFGGIRRWWSDFRLRRKMAREASDAVGDGTAETGEPSKN
jgi:hypothetical protein